VAECAIIGVADELKGQVPRGLVVVKAGVDVEADGDRIRRELIQRVRDEVGAVAALRRVDIVTALPKTRSGKILRRTMREIADGKGPATPPTIEDATVLEKLTPVLRSPAEPG
jgi:propionyl-CoA synthetase